MSFSLCYFLQVLKLFQAANIMNNQFSLLPWRQQNVSCFFIVLMSSWNGSSCFLLKVAIKEALKVWSHQVRNKLSADELYLPGMALLCSFSSFAVQDFGVANDAIFSREKFYNILPEYHIMEMRNQETRKSTRAKHTT